MPRLKIFYRLIVRPLYREPLRAALILFAVALGVAVVLAIELAGDAAAGSFRSSMETLTGNADLEISAVGGVPDNVVGILATLPYRIEVRPRIEDYAVLASGKTVPILGLDLIAERPENLSQVTEKLSEQDQQQMGQDGIWASDSLGVKPGDRVSLVLNDRTETYPVFGVLNDQGDHGDLILMDIATAQRALRRDGRVDRITLQLPAGANLAQWEQRLRSALPSGVELRPAGAQTEDNRRMLGAFRWNLRVLSYVALVVGAFLIYNTISLSVVRRRAEIGIVRALGASRSAVLAAFLGEALCFGIAGGLLGVALGRLLAIGTVRLLGATVQALYITSNPGAISLTLDSVALGLTVAIAVSVASAAAPAREASQVSPVEAMARARREYSAHVNKWRELWLAALMALTATIASFAPPVHGKPFFGYFAAVMFIGASACAIPAMVAGLTRFGSVLLQRLLGVEALLASRSLAASLRRTSVLVGALSTAIAMMVSIGIMVGSFRQTVEIWIDQQLKADLFLRPAGDPASDQHPTIDPNITDRIAALPGVAGVDRFRGYELTVDGLAATLGSVDTQGSHDLGEIRFLSGRSVAQVNAEMRSGNKVSVSEPFANKHHVKTGDFITLPLGQQRVRFRIADVFYDYGSEKGYIVVDRSVLLRYLPDPAPSNLAVYLAPGAHVNDVKSEVGTIIAGHDVLVFTNRVLREEAMRIFDRTFAITYALEGVAILVAVMGIAGALLGLVIDRRREFGMLRFLGAALPQIRRLILMEAGLLGLLSNIAGMALGLVLAVLLVFVINKQSFGWTIQFHWPVAVLMAALSGVYLSTLLAGFYPARVATRLNPIEVVHEE